MVCSQRPVKMASLPLLGQIILHPPLVTPLPPSAMFEGIREGKEQGVRHAGDKAVVPLLLGLGGTPSATAPGDELACSYVARGFCMPHPGSRVTSAV